MEIQARLKRSCVPLLALLLVVSARSQALDCEWKDIPRLVAVGDVHGDCDQLVKCLLATGLIDKQNKWIGGTTHLVQTGDVLDRGPDSKKALDLLMDLEPQAKEAGGCVHALLGNHEAMILGRDYRYLYPGETEPYGGEEAFVKAMGPQGKYGKWIRKHQTVIKINDILFVHGGISPTYGLLSLEEINAKIGKSLDEPLYSSAAEDEDGPLWYRDLGEDLEESVKTHLAPILKKYGVKHIVVGHTVPSSGQRIAVRADERVIMIDVGMSQAYRGGPAMCLLVENGKFFAVTPEEKVDLFAQPPQQGLKP